MNDASRGGIIFGVIIGALVAYFAIWMPGCTADNTGGAVTETGGRTLMVVGETAPDFSKMSVDGREITLSEYTGEKAVVIDFWATWCGPCMMELPILEAFYEKYSDRVEVIAVTSEPVGKANDIQAVIDEKGLTFTIIHDPSSSISNMYPTRGIPYLVMIGIDGTAVDTHLGMDPDIEATFVELFNLNAPPEPPSEEVSTEEETAGEESTDETINESGE